jgi:pimeloyl-ACP methyl ester carboxylesterase
MEAWMALRALTIAVLVFAVSSAGANDICQTKYTSLHYTQSECFEISRPVSPEDSSVFNLRAVLLTKNLAEAANKPTLVLIPGGPGESAEPLKTELQKKELINSMWYHLGLNVVLFDPRGTGLSKLPKPTTAYGNDAISIKRSVEDLHALVKQIRPGQKVSLFAHSAGGHVALAFALEHPELVEKVILMSASPSPRTMSRLNQALLGKDFWIWDDYVRANSGTIGLETAIRNFRRISDVLAQQLKARLLGHHSSSQLKGFTPLLFREELLRRMEQEAGPEGVFKWLESLNAKLDEIERLDGPLVPEELRILKITEAHMKPIHHDAKSWIQTLVMCGEGTTTQELNFPLFYDGLTMRRFCGDIVAPPHLDALNLELPLEKILAPVLILNGKDDTKVPPFVAREMARRLINSELVIETGTGHEFVDKKPMTLYRSLERFFSK